MKIWKLLMLVFLYTNCHSQESNRLLEMRPVADLSTFPIYPRMVEKVNGREVWKPNYRYMDSIDISGITYSSDGLEVRGLLVTPIAEGTYPCVIYNRGGNRDFGALTIATAALMMGELAKEGYIVIASNYRGNGGGEGQEEFGGKDVNDVINLIEVLKDIKGADTEKIGMYGWSRGGMMTYIALTKTDQIKAAVVGGAVSNQFSSIADRPNMETGVLAELIPNYATNKEAELTKRSAVKWVDKFPKNAPILMLHGNSDWRVKAEQSLELAMAFEKERVPYRLIIFEGGDHGIWEHRAEVNQQVVNWFDKYLKEGAALPNMEYHGR